MLGDLGDIGKRAVMNVFVSDVVVYIQVVSGLWSDWKVAVIRLILNFFSVVSRKISWMLLATKSCCWRYTSHLSVSLFIFRMLSISADVVSLGQMPLARWTKQPLQSALSYPSDEGSRLAYRWLVVFDDTSLLEALISTLPHFHTVAEGIPTSTIVWKCRSCQSVYSHKGKVWYS